MSKKMYLPESLRAVAANHFRLLESRNVHKKRDALELTLSGYGDVVYLIGDIIKVSLLALEGAKTENCSAVPEPSTNISGVLGIVLNLLPYEEMDLLDILREAVLDPAEAEEELFVLENFLLTIPTAMQN